MSKNTSAGAARVMVARKIREARRSLRSVARLSVVLLMLSIGAAVVPSVASATWWRYGYLHSETPDAYITRTQLSMSTALGDHGRYVQAGAHYPGGWTLWGSYYQALNEVCQTYPSFPNLGALIRNPHSVPQDDVWGIDGFVQNGTPQWC